MDEVVPGGGFGAGKTVRASVVAALFLALWIFRWVRPNPRVR